MSFLKLYYILFNDFADVLVRSRIKQCKIEYIICLREKKNLGF